MKEIKIGKKEYDLMQTPFDIGDERFNVFKQYILQSFDNIDKPLWKSLFSKCKAHYNSNQHSDIIIEMFNFDKSIEIKDFNYDAYSICFALICLEKGEEQSDFGTDRQLRKLEEMRSNGLTRGMVEQEVENFMTASPRIFSPYLAMLKMIQEEQLEAHLKE